MCMRGRPRRGSSARRTCRSCSKCGASRRHSACRCCPSSRALQTRGCPSWSRNPTATPARPHGQTRRPAGTTASAGHLRLEARSRSRTAAPWAPSWLPLRTLWVPAELRPRPSAAPPPESLRGAARHAAVALLTPLPVLAQAEPTCSWRRPCAESSTRSRPSPSPRVCSAASSRRCSCCCLGAASRCVVECGTTRAPSA